MKLCETGKRQKFEVTKILMREQVGKNPVTVVVPRPERRLRVAAENYFERRIRRIARKIFVGVNVDSRGMIYREQTYSVEIHRFLERLHEAEAEFAVFLANRVAIELHVLDGPRNVTFAGADPVADNTSTEHVAD